VNLPVTRLFVEEIIVECRKKNITKVDILGFEFEMGLFPNVLDEARGKGIDIAPKYIPAEVFDKRAVEKNQMVFHDVSFIEVKVIHGAAHGVSGNPTVSVQLTDFSVFYSQDSTAAAEAALADAKRGGSKIVVEKGQIVKISRDAQGHHQAGTVDGEVAGLGGLLGGGFRLRIQAGDYSGGGRVQGRPPAHRRSLLPCRVVSRALPSAF